MARPSKLNDELIQQFVEQISKGLPVQTTCDYLYVTQPSFNNWMRQGEEDINNDNCESVYAQFFLEIKRAKAVFEIEARDKIKDGASGWQGMAWWLERTRPQYMPKQEITAGDDGKVTVVLGGKVKDVKQC